ncbi:MAG: SH3 domain-containing protein [Roseiflexaceae bacterium]|nr:SH3 domain-containing protein [Roseiflexus sp.]MDW8212444.1 SH3 domain-containing protein [Roseiflexaceae bacterium]
MRSDDWDRLFAPNAPKRGGPLRALINLVLFALLLGVLAMGVAWLVSQRQQQAERLAATATAYVGTVVPQLTSVAGATQTVEAQGTATRIALRTATAQAAANPTSTPEPGIGRGEVVRGGNLRREPLITQENVVGLIYPGDRITFLERRTVGGQVWFRIRVDQPAPERSGEGVPAGTEGWASALLLSTPP